MTTKNKAKISSKQDAQTLKIKDEEDKSKTRS